MSPRPKPQDRAALGTKPKFCRGEVLLDVVGGRVGEYRGIVGPYALLRPLGGGCEWECSPDILRPLTSSEAERLAGEEG